MLKQQQQQLWVMVGILLLAVFLRVWQFGEAPPGLQHDEIFKAQEGQRLIEEGEFRIFYPSNQGHEGGFVWVLGLSYVLFGTTFMMLKFPALVFGILTIAMLYRFSKDVYGYFVAVMASGLASVSFWGVFTSRVGLRAGMLPFVTLLVLWGLHQLVKNQRENRWRRGLFTGFWLGFAIYTYTASFALYLAFALFLTVLLIFHRATFRKRFLELIIVSVVAGILILPMLYTRLTDTEGLNRVQSISKPLDELGAGNPQLVIANLWSLLGAPAFTGDPTWRYNVAERPLFWLPIGLLVYLGFAIAVGRSRKEPITAMVVALSLFGLIPSMLTVLAPSYLRSIIVLPSVMIFIALAIDFAISHISLSDGQHKVIGWGIGLGIIAITGVRDYQAYFDEWKNAEEVHTIYRDDLQQLATYVREHDEDMVFVSTTNAELDRFIYKFSNAPNFDETQVVFFDARSNIVLNDEPTLLFVSSFSPISDVHQEWLSEEVGTEFMGQVLRQDQKIAFDIYEVGSNSQQLAERLQSSLEQIIYVAPMEPEFPAGRIYEWGKAISFPINFGNVVQLIGVEAPYEVVFNEKGIPIQLYFRPLVAQSSLPLNVFVHVITRNQTIVAQRDLLGILPSSWSDDMIFAQDHFVPFYTPCGPRYIQ